MTEYNASLSATSRGSPVSESPSYSSRTRSQCPPSGRRSPASRRSLLGLVPVQHAHRHRLRLRRRPGRAQLRRQRLRRLRLHARRRRQRRTQDRCAVRRRGEPLAHRLRPPGAAEHLGIRVGQSSRRERRRHPGAVLRQPEPAGRRQRQERVLCDQRRQRRDLSFVVVTQNPSGTAVDTYDADPWFMEHK
jgi:hypothetical protein